MGSFVFLADPCGHQPIQGTGHEGNLQVGIDLEAYLENRASRWKNWIASKGWARPERPQHAAQGVNIFMRSPWMGLKCFPFPLRSVRLFSVAVAAIRASPARRPPARPYSSM